MGLETITDSALDCTYLLITTNIEGSSSSTCNNQPGVEQFRLLLEQRSTGYNWPSPASSCSLDAATASGSEPSKGLSKSRLSGLKQVRNPKMAGTTLKVKVTSAASRCLLRASQTCANASARGASSSWIDVRVPSRWDKRPSTP